MSKASEFLREKSRDHYFSHDTIDEEGVYVTDDDAHEYAKLFHLDELFEFQELIKERTVIFDYDKEDGYFIKVTGKGQNNHYVDVAELIPTKHHNIAGAMKFAVEYMVKKDDEFKKHLQTFNK